MRTTETVHVPAPAALVFPHVERLESYPAWLRLVHTVELVADDPPAWNVELRARVGPFARSKRLRMVRVDHEPDRAVAFERAEIDGRDHARWALRTELETEASGTVVTMHLAYDGALWTGGVLARVLDDEVRRGRAALIEAVRSGPTR